MIRRDKLMECETDVSAIGSLFSVPVLPLLDYGMITTKHCMCVNENLLGSCRKREVRSHARRSGRGEGVTR